MNWLEAIGEDVYKNIIDTLGEPVSYLTLVQNADATTGSFVEYTSIRAVLKLTNTNTSNELLGSIEQYEFKCYILENDLTLLGVTTPKRGDKIRYRGKLYNVESVDNATRAINANVIAYVFILRG